MCAVIVAGTRLLQLGISVSVFTVSHHRLRESHNAAALVRFAGLVVAGTGIGIYSETHFTLQGEACRKKSGADNDEEHC